MKKMLVLRQGSMIARHEVEDYLTDSEAIRNDYIDFDPIKETTHKLGEYMIYESSWNIVFKDDDEYDLWHILAETEVPMTHEHPLVKAAIDLISPYRSDHVILTTTLYNEHSIVLVWKIRKTFSELIDNEIPTILASFEPTEGIFSYRISQELLGRAQASTEEPEDREHAEGSLPADNV